MTCYEQYLHAQQNSPLEQALQALVRWLISEPRRLLPTSKLDRVRTERPARMQIPERQLGSAVSLGLRQKRRVPFSPTCRWQ